MPAIPRRRLLGAPGLGADARRLAARMMEVFAGFLSHTDHHLGRVIDFLKETGQFDNTLIMLVSDNGASAEGGVQGATNELQFFNNAPETLEESLRSPLPVHRGKAAHGDRGRVGRPDRRQRGGDADGHGAAVSLGCRRRFGRYGARFVVGCAQAVGLACGLCRRAGLG
jgi:hypothetical protein